MLSAALRKRCKYCVTRMGTNSGNHYPRWIRCSYCDELVLTNGSRATCPECKRERERDRCMRHRMQYKAVPRVSAYIVVYDPDDIGGFPIGAVISHEQLKYMLMATNCSFTPGTLLKDSAGDIFIIKVDKRGGEKLIHE